MVKCFQVPTRFPLGQGSRESQGNSWNLLEGKRKSGKLEISWKISEKSKERKFLAI